MIPYILYASLILTACLIFYKLLLQKETFFRLNRFVLLACMLLAFILPVLQVPQQMSFRKAPVSAETILPENAPFKGNVNQPAVNTVDKIVSEPEQKTPVFNLEKGRQWLIYLYWFGVIVFGLNFLMQVIVLLYKAYTRPVIIDGKFRIVEIAGDKAPCSFGNNIFINPEKYDWETYNQVLLHEKIHIEQKHTLDLLLAEIVLVFQWFNPFAWQWRKELEKNLEFFTDEKLLQHDAVEKESYQMSLVKVAAPHFPLSLTTNYNQSLLKKRLLMMNSKKSNVHTIWKYFFLLPLMVVFVCLFNEPVANSQTVASKVKKKTQEHNSTEMKTEGSWFATIKGERISFQFGSDDQENFHNRNSFLVSDFKDLPRDKQGVFSLAREAGTMEFTGKFEGDQGTGKYKFTPDKSYSDAMQKEGIDATKDNDLMALFLVNLKRSYVTMLKNKGYTDLDKYKLSSLAVLDVNEGYITSIKEAGFADIDLGNLVQFRSLAIDKAYIDEIRKAGYEHLTPDKVITFKAQGIDLIAFKALNIDKDFINSFKEVGYTNLSNSDLISMKALGVTPEFAKSFRNAGYTNIKADDLVGLKVQNVTTDLVKQYKDLGFENIDLDVVMGAKVTGTSPSFIKSMREKGHNMKSLEKYIALRSVLGN
ncbi:MAG: M56 family metallopeptidase [Ferruginibacter sp.]